MSKSTNVMNSIALTFSNDAVPERLEAQIVPAPEESFREGNTLDHIDALFKSHISGIKVARNRLGTAMHMRLPVVDFEQYINDPTSRFMPVLVSLLDTEETGPYRMDLVLNLVETPAQVTIKDPQQAAQKTKQVAEYAVQLEKIGLPRKLLTTGLGQGEAGFIDIFVRRYEPYSPVNPTQEQDQDGGNENV